MAEHAEMVTVDDAEPAEAAVVRHNWYEMRTCGGSGAHTNAWGTRCDEAWRGERTRVGRGGGIVAVGVAAHHREPLIAAWSHRKSAHHESA